jgi:hypothetical protein
MVYQLNLSKHWKIHDIFHVSLLKKKVFDPIHVLPKLLKIMDAGDIIPEPIFF